MHFQNAHKKTILIVEDEDQLRDLLQEELAALGFKVAAARNGVEGLEKLQDIEPDIIICDRAMPAMTGYELLDRIRGIYPQYKDVPFIFLTALTDSRDRNAVVPLKPFAYLEKPLDFKILTDTLAKALKKPAPSFL
jgi:CheY-like chemotaxis protein